MGNWRKDAALRQEQMLLGYVERLDRFRQGRLAIHLHLSRLRPHNLLDHHLRIALASFDELGQKYDGGLFRMASGDIVFVAKGATAAEIDRVVTRLRYLFGEDPLLALDGGSAFCTRYDLETAYDALLTTARRMTLDAADEAGAPARPGPSICMRPLDPDRLGRLEKALSSADLAPFVRRQPVCMMSPDAASGAIPRAVFSELYVSIGDLRSALLPDCDIASDRWLFQHMTRVLDRRMLAALEARGHLRWSGALARDFSLNLNVSTVLAPEFLEFDRAISEEVRGTIIVEIQPVDVFADTGAFMFARDFLRDRGYKLCLDGLKHLMLPMIDREWLGFDLVKFHWGPDLVDDLGGKRAETLQEVAVRIGRDRLILTRCDSPDALKAGASLGVTMYQGRLLDKQLKAAAATP